MIIILKYQKIILGDNERNTSIREKKNTKYTTFEAVKFTTQVVNGVMYRIKVKVGQDEYIHIRRQDYPYRFQRLA